MKTLASVAVGITAGFALAAGLPAVLGLWDVPGWVTSSITVLCLAAWAWKRKVDK